MLQKDNRLRDSGSDIRVGLFSLRNKERLVSRFNNYEFENVICGLENAELIIPEPLGERTRLSKIKNKLTKRLPIRRTEPVVKPLKLEKNYDLFFVNCLFIHDLDALRACTDWRSRSKTAVCWITELWSRDLERFDHYLEILSQFDCIILTFYHSHNPLKKLINKPVICMIPGIDAIRFSPYPRPPQRCIYLCNIGRRSRVTHDAMLEYSEREGLFYVYDTFENMRSPHFEHHRMLLSNLIKRSRYFFANRAKIDRFDESNGQNEISLRFVEGAAGGSVMIGEPPDTPMFLKHFDWPDAVISVPFDSADIEEILKELDTDTERLERIRTNGIVNSLDRNDWVYRWAGVLDEVGIPYTEKMMDRVKNLQHLADLALSGATRSLDSFTMSQKNKSGDFQAYSP